MSAQKGRQKSTKQHCRDHDTAAPVNAGRKTHTGEILSIKSSGGATACVCNCYLYG